MTESIERIDKKKKYRVCLGVCMLAINEKDKIYTIIEFFCHLSEKFCSHL